MGLSASRTALLALACVLCAALVGCSSSTAKSSLSPQTTAAAAALPSTPVTTTVAPPVVPSSSAAAAPPGQTFAGTAGYTDAQNYQFSVKYSFSITQPSTIDQQNEQPGQAAIYQPINFTASLTNATPGRNAPYDLNSDFDLIGLFAMTRPICHSLDAPGEGVLLTWGAGNAQYCVITYGSAYPLGDGELQPSQTMMLTTTPQGHLSVQSPPNVPDGDAGYYTTNESDLAAYQADLAQGPDSFVLLGNGMATAPFTCSYQSGFDSMPLAVSKASVAC